MQSNIAPNCMVVTPHHLATQSAVAILKQGGTAMEATVAAAATLAVVYPHMNTIGGDGFWLILPPHDDPIVIEACGAAGSLATPKLYRETNKIPYKGSKSAITVAGTVGGWQEALNYVSECGYQRISLAKLLEDAIQYAEEGFPITRSQHEALKRCKSMKNISSYFQRVFFPDGQILKEGERFFQKDLAKTLRTIADDGLSSFYKGAIAQLIFEDMEHLGIPITKADLENYSPVRKTPLRLLLKSGEVFNTPPPTQGLVSLSVLGQLDVLNIDGQNEGQFIHTTIEATKRAFVIRDQYITDPRYMKVNSNSLLSKQAILKMAYNIDSNKASDIGEGKVTGDTIWMGVMDSKGFSVSFIQSVYHEFGSGVLLPKTGILWNNRGIAFSLESDHLLSLQPGKKPYHTLNPAAARLSDGRVIIYGTRGGDGQPQTQAAIFHRYVVQGLNLQSAVSAPRWVYGRVSGDPDDKVKIEDRFSEETVNYLKKRGHDIVFLSPYSEVVGQAGALVRHPDGMVEGAFDPRSNGSAAGF